jgi:hypothetical protein
MNHNSEIQCVWCGAAFAPRKDGGKRQRFCRRACGRAFDRACRNYARRGLAEGTLTMDELKAGPQRNARIGCGGQGRANSPQPAPEGQG